MTTKTGPAKMAAAIPQAPPQPFILPGTTVGGDLGIFRVDFTLRNPSNGQSRALNGLVDTGASYTVIPAAVLAVLAALGVMPLRSVRVRYGDGSFAELDLGEAQMELEGMTSTVQVLFGNSGDTFLLGAMALEAFALAADATNRRLIPAQVTA